MECPSCGFNNIPGTTRCARCQAHLTAQEAAAPQDLAPPRAGRLKALRPLWYRVNRMLDHLPRRVPQRVARLFVGTVLPGDAVGAMVLSALPGLGHLVTARRRGGLVAFAGWGVLAALAAFVYGGAMGWALLGLVGVWHASVMFHAGKVQHYARTVGSRLRVMLLVLLATSVGYFAIDRVVRIWYDFLLSPMAVPQLEVARGDVLLIRRAALRTEDFSRGEMVSFYLDHYGYQRLAGYYVNLGPRRRTVGRILAVAGDTIEVSRERTLVNGAPVDLRRVAEARLPLPGRPCSFTVGRDKLLIVFPVATPEYAPANAGQVAGEIWRQLFVVSVAGVRGRVRGVHLPLRRRHRFGSTALPFGEPKDM